MFLDILESSESVFVCYIFFMSHMSNHVATYPTSTATRWDVFRNFQNVTNFDAVDICHQKHVGDFPTLFRNYPLCVFVVTLLFACCLKNLRTKKTVSSRIQTRRFNSARELGSEWCRVERPSLYRYRVERPPLYRSRHRTFHCLLLWLSTRVTTRAFSIGK